MKKFILMIILTASFIRGCTTSDTADNADNNDLSKTIHAYSDVLSQKLENSKSENNKLAAQIIYLNDDEIPELVIFDDDKAPASVHIYTFQDNEAIELTSDDENYGNYGALVYYEKQAMLQGCNETISNDLFHGFTYYFLWDGINNTLSLTQSTELITSVSDEDTSKEYYIDQKPVDEVTFSRLQAEYEDKKPDTLNYNDAYPISSKENIKEFTRHLL